jgi:hypothetical protein
MKIVATGGTGFVGRALVHALLGDGAEVTVITRDVERARPRLPARCRLATWDPGDLGGAIEAADAVVNLAGEGVAEGRWTAHRREAIRSSRVSTTRALVDAIERLAPGRRPHALVSASAVGYYGDRGDEILIEEAAAGPGFLAEVCGAWEAEAGRAAALGVRTAITRIGVVLGRGGGALERMLPPFRLGLGGRLGPGTQWMSWIHRDDLVALLRFALERASVSGVMNAVAPEPVRNDTFTRALGATLGRPALLPVPAAALRLALGEMSAILLASQRVRCAAAERAGFGFRYREVGAALAEILSERGREIEHEQWFPRRPAEVFAFFSDPHNLERITPDFLRFRVLGTSTPEIRRGTRIDYRLSLRGLPIRWQSVIECWEPGVRFVDVQTRGPYRSWRHTHEFDEHAGGTIVRDRVRYELPFGAVGDLLALGLVERDLAAIFAYRRERLAELLR